MTLQSGVYFNMSYSVHHSILYIYIFSKSAYISVYHNELRIENSNDLVPFI